jgi:hypothetical protein
LALDHVDDPASDLPPGKKRRDDRVHHERNKQAPGEETEFAEAIVK